MAGRKRTPTVLKLVTGNPGKRALPKKEPKPKGVVGAPPAWLTTLQKSIWRETVNDAPTGVLAAIDSKTLLVFVVAASEHEESAKLTAKSGLTVKTDKGNEIQAPWVGTMNRAALLMLRAAAEMGFTPASRSKVTAVDDDDEEADPAAKFFQ
jgi:P27 family predicted phage terminase small subunit